ncbi:MAG: isochorismatase family protein [Nitrospira sp. BO4]|jgi:nicotinamidase/pyrazinamidase|nr:isochorismatase family protein [Nitrospira sp. BO4]
MTPTTISLTPSDALLLTDIQKDFLPRGALGIRDGDEIIPILEHYVCRFAACGLSIFLTRDWHPPDHCSFVSQGGPWPTHCVAGSPGALPPSSFVTPSSAVIIYKAIDRDQEAYSAFHNTSLDRHLRALHVQRLFIGGLATDYCVLHSVKNARTLGYDVCLLMDGIKAVNLQPDDGHLAEEVMISLGAVPVRWEMLEA